MQAPGFHGGEVGMRRQVGRPSTSSSASQNFSSMHITKIQPSAVLNSCTGVAEGCELRGSRPVRRPSFRYQVAG